MTNLNLSSGRIILAVTVFALLGWDATPSWSYGDMPAAKAGVAVVDICRPLLDQRAETVAPAASVPGDPVLAGRAAVIGMIFGVHSALGPREANQTAENDGIDSDQAWAIAAYRHCRSRQALETAAAL